MSHTELLNRLDKFVMKLARSVQMRTLAFTRFHFHAVPGEVLLQTYTLGVLTGHIPAHPEYGHGDPYINLMADRYQAVQAFRDYCRKHSKELCRQEMLYSYSVDVPAHGSDAWVNQMVTHNSGEAAECAQYLRSAGYTARVVARERYQ